MIERRHATIRPHYRHSAEREYLCTLAWAMVLGAVIGAVTTLMVIT